MIVGDLSPVDLRRRLEGPGLRITLGPLVAEIRSTSRLVQSAVEAVYAAHRIPDSGEFADFHVAVRSAGGIRRWLKPLVEFGFDGAPPVQPLPAGQAFPLLEWGLNWCVASHCHQYLMIHAAVVERAGRALVLPAPPGSGKSTLCAALVARGWRLLSDEMTLIDVDRGDVIPLPRPISLKNRSIAIIGRFWPDAIMSAVVHDTIKGSIAHVRPPLASVDRSTERAVPGWIVLPRYTPDAATKLEALSKGAAFMQVLENAFNYSMHGRRGFEVLADFVDASESFEFSYGGDLEAAIDAFDALARPL